MLFISTLFIVFPSFAQPAPRPQSSLSTAPPAVFLPKDSPHLYRLFFYSHRSLDALVQQQKMGRTPVELQRIDRDLTSTFGLASIQTLPILRAVSNSFAAELAAIDAEETAHANSRARLELSPLPAQLRAFEARRDAVVARGIAALRSQLGPVEWTRFETYINGPHRTSYAVVSARR